MSRYKLRKSIITISILLTFILLISIDYPLTVWLLHSVISYCIIALKENYMRISLGVIHNSGVLMITVYGIYKLLNDDPIPISLLDDMPGCYDKPVLLVKSVDTVLKCEKADKEEVGSDWTVVRSTKRNRTKSSIKKAADDTQNSTALKKKTRNKKKKTKDVISSGQSWSNLVSQDNKYQPSEAINSIPDIMELPCLSDNDSCNDSVDTPSLSHDFTPSVSTASTTSLPSPLTLSSPPEYTNYYSPFSTGFDLGIIPPYQPTVSYTQIHKVSMLNLLHQPDYVETSITAKTFSYFDDIMLSSLYQHHEYTP